MGLNAMTERWLRLHRIPAARQSLDRLLRESWERSLAADVDGEEAMPRPVSQRQFEQIKKNTRRLYIYGTSILQPIAKSGELGEMGALLFDDGCCLLQLFGSERFLDWADRSGIHKGARWTEEAIGANAVCIGARERRPVLVEGAENYARFLTGGTYAYAPVKREDNKLSGGVLLVETMPQQAGNMLPVATSLALAIELQLYWSWTVACNYLAEGTGLISIDQSIGQNRVLLMSEEVVNILGIPKRDYFYYRLEEIIEDTPQNRVFWEIIRSRRTVADRSIILQVGGKQVTVSLSVLRYNEQKFHMHGVTINLSSIKRINRLVSQHAGNLARYGFEDIIGESEPMTGMLRRVKTAAQTDSNILLQGESGVGKDIVAQAIHNNSGRRDRPFVAINCAAFSKELMASELFGYESGAFTGAKKEGAMGKFELAEGGTLFLDEIGDMPIDLQALLLRVLEERAFRKVGGNALVKVNVRIIAATNQNLMERIAAGLFREDLFYRLGIIRIHIPPLRSRGGDALLLAGHFAGQICARLGKPTVRLSDSAERFFRQYAWPGNVRELQNLLEGIISTSDEPVIDEAEIRSYLGDFGGQLRRADAPPAPREPEPQAGELVYDERRAMVHALKVSNNNKTKAAASLNMPLRTFYRRMKKYGMM